MLKYKQGGNSMKKRILAVLLAGCMVMGLAACSSGGEAEKEGSGETGQEENSQEPAEKSSGELTIGYSYPTANNEFW